VNVEIVDSGVDIEGRYGPCAALRSPASFTHRESAIDVDEDHKWAHGDLEWATLERREEILWLCVLR
jgi:hypothetical protein